MRPRPGDSPQRSGRRFERIFANLFGKSPTRGSGNQWFVKMDVLDGTITWSCKYTESESLSITKSMLREVEQGVYKNGDNSIPGIAAAVDGGTEVVVVLKYEDFLRLLSKNPNGYISPSKAEAKRAAARIPVLFRDESDEV